MRTLAQTFPMESRHTRLRPPRMEFITELYNAASQERIPWLWHGGQRAIQEFQAMLQTADVVQFAIEDRRTGRQVGLISAYDLDLFHGTAYVRLALLPDFRRKVWPLEGTVLFANYMFTKFNLRKLCGRSIDDNFMHLRSGENTFFEVEGCLKDHYIFDGKPQDMYLASLDRLRWRQVGLPLLERIVRPA